ncbi:NAD(P)H-binding protein [Streptomyces sp. NPDC101225]|uniref:NAD(P)H-binding protein n=1 Tax=Streptomyces sp. NPDC101225 TaxID=3366135 RepID=UPI00381B21CB
MTGASGTVGREVVRRLPPQHTVRVMTRRPDTYRHTRPGTQVVGGDFTDEDSLARAVRGVTAAFLVTSPLTTGWDERFLHAAHRARVEHVVKLSAAAVLDPGADDTITRRQRTCEYLLRTSGLAWTLLRPRAYMSNTLTWAHTIRTQHTVHALHHTSPVACIDPRDIADVAAHTLTQPQHTGHAYQLTGPTPLTPLQQTTTLAHLLGHPLHCHEQGEHNARTTWRTTYPEPIVQALLHRARRQQAGTKTHTHTTTITHTTGHPARTYTTWATDHLTHFT